MQRFVCLKCGDVTIYPVGKAISCRSCGCQYGQAVGRSYRPLRRQLERAWAIRKPFRDCPSDCKSFPHCASTEGCLEKIEAIKGV